MPRTPKTYTARYTRTDHSLTGWITTVEWCFDYADAHGWRVWEIKRNPDDSPGIACQTYHGA